jgi:DNA-binding NarL/FixJ family response regulator
LKRGDEILTDREYEVASLANNGLSNKQIARLLLLSEGTVKQYLHSIFTKLGIQGRMLLLDRLPPRRDRAPGAEQRSPK